MNFKSNLLKRFGFEHLRLTSNHAALILNILKPLPEPQPVSGEAVYLSRIYGPDNSLLKVRSRVCQAQVRTSELRTYTAHLRMICAIFMGICHGSEIGQGDPILGDRSKGDNNISKQ